MSALILRHTVKYSYLSTRFKVIVSVFGILALIVFLFSIFLIFQLNGELRTPSFTPSAPSDVEIQF
jgi:predicted permease